MGYCQKMMEIDWDNAGFNQSEYDSRAWVPVIRDDWFEKLMKAMYGPDYSMYTQ